MSKKKSRHSLKMDDSGEKESLPREDTIDRQESHSK
jgi:hypothetical protein